jgi:hypothetical protein
VKNRGQIEPEIIPVLRKKGGVMEKGLLGMFIKKGVVITQLLKGSGLGKQCCGANGTATLYTGAGKRGKAIKKVGTPNHV